MGVFAEFEQSIIQERVRSGIKRVRAAGQRWGRRTIEETDPASRTKILDLRRQGLGMAAIGKQVGVSSRTVWRFLRGITAKSTVGVTYMYFWLVEFLEECPADWAGNCHLAHSEAYLCFSFGYGRSHRAGNCCLHGA